jgi:holo-[acyl-carrier protein] synthase
VITGLGVDIVEIDRMRAALERHPRMKERLFSAEERAYCDKRNRPEIHYALRFAAKEAVLKALGSGFAGMRFTDVEVARDPSGRPTPVLKGRAAALAEEYGVLEMHLSLSFTHTTAVASAVAITEEGRPRPKAQPADPKAELAAAFKEARAMLDGLSVEDAPAEGESVAEEGSQEDQ